jgi:hypothetical protein
MKTDAYIELSFEIPARKRQAQRCVDVFNKLKDLQVIKDVEEMLGRELEINFHSSYVKPTIYIRNREPEFACSITGELEEALGEEATIHQDPYLEQVSYYFSDFKIILANPKCHWIAKTRQEVTTVIEEKRLVC